MTLVNKAAIVTEYAAKRDALRGITQVQIDSSLQGLDDFVKQCDEAVMVLKAREALGGAGAPVPVVSAALIATLSAKVADVKSQAAGIRTLVNEVKATIPD